jgi:CRISPR/Cas system CSM-associated protein Csm3 (group 7 of RAMP superfamily)
MKEILYKVEFLSFWHVGSGLSGGTYAQALVNKDDNQLPKIPGRTIKGLLSEAANNIKEFSNNKIVKSDFIKKVFGEQPKDNKTHDSKNKTGMADTFFTNMCLSHSMANELIKDKLQMSLYQTISSTKIDKFGTAETNSLRQMEVTIPLTLFGKIYDFPNDKESLEQLTACFNMVKEMGVNRNRGLGRCIFSIIKD